LFGEWRWELAGKRAEWIIFRVQVAEFHDKVVFEEPWISV